MWCKWKRKSFSRHAKKGAARKELLSPCFWPELSFLPLFFIGVECESKTYHCLMPHTRTLLEKNFWTPLQPWKSSQVNQVDTTVQRCSNSSAIVFFLVVSNMSKSFCTRNIFYLHVNCELWTQPNVVELAWSKVETEGFRSSKSTNGNFKVLVGSIQFLAFFLPQSQTLKSIRPCFSRSQTTPKRTPEISAFSTCLKF